MERAAATIKKLMVEEEGTSIVEALSDLCHDQWSHWMEYLFSKSTANDDGSVTIPTDLVERWQTQIETPYEELSEEEKDSDRKEAAKFVKVFNDFGDHPNE